jgi:D-tyrosyl-tRNA(Tyr) deacylase
VARGLHPGTWGDRAAQPSVRALLQRATRAEVRVDGETVGAIGAGLVILLGIGPDDTEAIADDLARRAAELRIFRDADGRTNRSLVDTGGAALVVSQFTLYADTRRGRRPGFIGAAPAQLAERLWRRFADALGNLGV